MRGPNFLEIFRELPNTLEEIDAEIDSHQRSADSLFISNPKVIEDYEKRKEKIETLEKEIADRQAGLDRDKEEIGELEVSLSFSLALMNRRPGYLLSKSW